MNEELKIVISAEVAKLKQGMESAKKQVSGFKEQVSQAKENVDSNFAAMGTSVSNGLKVVGTTIAATGAALLALGASTAEYRNEQAKLVTAFESAGASASTAKETYNDLYRVLGDGGQATEAANHLAKLTTEEKALNEWTNICQGVYATFGASLPIEGLTEAANETAKVGTVTGGLADALNWAGISEDAFNEKLAKCNTEAEREKLIRQTLNGVYSDAAAKYEKNNEATLKQNEAQAKLQETTAKLGEAVAPVITAFTSFANDALSAVMPYITDLAEAAIPKLEEVLGTVGEKLGEVMGYIVDNWSTITTIAAIIGGITTAIGLYNVVAAIKAAMAVAEVTTVWGLVAAYTAQAAAMVVALAPYLLIVAAIAAVIAIIVLCIKHWDDIKAATKKAFDKIKEVVSNAIDKVVGFFKKIFNWIKDNWQGLLLLILNPFAGAFKLAYDNCEGFREKVNAFVAKVKELFKKGFDYVKEKIINPIKDAHTKVKETLFNFGVAIGEKLGSIKEKVTSIFGKVKDAITKPVINARDKVKEVIDKIKGFFNFKWSLPKLKTPKFSIKPSGWSVGDLLKGSIPKLSVSWNARGGVFDKPTVLNYGNSLQGLGEDGAEAIVPLEKNTQWLDKMATMLATKLGGGSSVVLEVDGKRFGEVAVNSINSITKQTGSLPLKLA